ncbi:MAG: VWA domain-containing protein [Candidatus Acidiferrales bacterium]
MRARYPVAGTLWLALLLACGAGLLALAGQPPPPEEKQGPLPPHPPPGQQPGYTLSVDVPLVNVDLTVVDRGGNFVSGLQKEHFRVYQDGEEQEIVAFAPSEAPLTTVLVVETTPGVYYLLWEKLDAAYSFLRQLRQGDWIALVGFDLKPRIIVDFTQNAYEVGDALRQMQYGAGGFRETNTFDALVDTLKNLRDVDGKKSIVLVGTGINTLTTNVWDDIRRIVREERTTIFCIGMTWTLENYYDRLESYGYRVHYQRSELLMAENQLKTLAQMSGGRAYFPRFITELPSVYQEIGAMLRNQYSLAFRPRNFQRDGKYHKIEVKLVGPDGQPLKVVDQKGKNVKYEIYARQGYYAPEA